MKNIHSIKREIAELALSGLNVQDLLNELQSTDWDIWIEEAVQRKAHFSIPATIIACETCHRNFEAKEGDIKGLSSCPKCKDEYNSRPHACCYCGKIYPYKDGMGWYAGGGPYCSENCQELEKEKQKVTCLACGVRFLPISEKGLMSHVPTTLCKVCFTPEMVKERNRVTAHNNRAIELGLEATLTLSQWLATLKHFDRKCAYCLMPFKHLEHVVPLELGGGTSIGNCVPSCKRCNSRKNVRTQEELHKYFPSDNLARIREYLASVMVASS